MSARKHRPFGRREPEKHRDARLFVIATEDTYAPSQYFGLFGGMSPRVKIVVSETTDNRSSPGHVVDRLLRYRDAEELNDDDRLWALIDTDHWIEPNHKPQLLEALKRAKENRITVAMSNPCFDLWLLLHHMDLPEDHGIVDGKGVSSYMRRNGIPFNKLRLDLGATVRRRCGWPLSVPADWTEVPIRLDGLRPRAPRCTISCLSFARPASCSAEHSGFVSCPQGNGAVIVPSHCWACAPAMRCATYLVPGC
jgi:hypothetical protein